MELNVGITPVHYCAGKGADIINSRLESFERIDASGVQSDQLTLEVNVEGLDSIPQEGAVLTWYEGYKETEVLEIGTFKITRITPRLFPRRITIVATAALFDKDDSTGFKERRSRSWDGKTLGEVFREVVEAHHLTPRVDPELDTLPLGHTDQTDETDAAFLTRIAEQYDAVAKPMDGMYVLALRGRTHTITGKEMPTVEVTVPPDNRPGCRAFINCQLDTPSRKNAGGVIAQWVDENGNIHEIKSGNPPYKRMPEPFVNKAHAEQALKGKVRKTKREASRLTLDIPGDPRVCAELPVVLDKTFPNGMAGTRSIDRVVVRGSRSGGYRMQVVATNLIA
ncbi:contractile injection system protein, VgrG/Pvc8 family [Plesiomonas shigelloides]|uniref:contractile injection system protein, VgrG/Pvc8 family n=2 Tax=Plesiomonas shigelloides TaxID=703 RepID=UPI0030C11ACD